MPEVAHGTPSKKPMSTALVRICTSHGMVIAADGLEASWLGIWTNHLQKIYPIHNLPMAYAIFGSTGIHVHGGKTIINFLEEARKSVEALKNFSSDDLSLYAQNFAAPIQQALKSVMTDGRITTYPSLPEPPEPGYTILHIFFFGYCRGVASTVDLRFSHMDHELAEPSVTSVEANLGRPVWTRGSHIIHGLLFDSDDERFEAYRRPFPEHPAKLTIPEAAEVASGYIEACSSPEGRDADPNVSFSIGGHIHCAKITPSRGFEWITPPK